jgi:FkbM family methyltransferase
MIKNLIKIDYRLKGLELIISENSLDLRFSSFFILFGFIKYFFSKGKSSSPLRQIELDIYNKLGEVFSLYCIKFIKPKLFEEFRIVVFEYNDLILPYLLKLDDYNSRNIGEGTYEFKNVVVNAGDIVVDAGANFGMFTLFCILKRDVKKVYAFEPSRIASYYFLENIKLNHVENRVILCQLGLSYNLSKVEFDENSSNFGGGKFVSNKKNSELKIETTTLDNHINGKVDFIKADIEGFERYLLLGSSKILTTYRPKVSICTYHYYYDKDLLNDILRFINPDYIIYHASGKMYCSV